MFAKCDCKVIVMSLQLRITEKDMHRYMYDMAAVVPVLAFAYNTYTTWLCPYTVLFVICHL